MVERVHDSHEYLSRWRYDVTARESSTATPAIEFRSVSRVAKWRETMMQLCSETHNSVEQKPNGLVEEDDTGSPCGLSGDENFEHEKQRSPYRRVRPQSATTVRMAPERDITSRPQSAKASRRPTKLMSPEKTTRRDLAWMPPQVQQSKWTEMLRSGPSFQEPGLLRLEDETYALLQRVLRKPRATRANAEPESGQRGFVKGTTTTKTVAVGSGLQVARQSKKSPKKKSAKFRSRPQAAPHHTVPTQSSAARSRPPTSTHGQGSGGRYGHYPVQMTPHRTVAVTEESSFKSEEKRRAEATARARVLEEMGMFSDLGLRRKSRVAESESEDHDAASVKISTQKKKTKKKKKTRATPATDICEPVRGLDSQLHDALLLDSKSSIHRAVEGGHSPSAGHDIHQDIGGSSLMGEEIEILPESSLVHVMSQGENETESLYDATSARICTDGKDPNEPTACLAVEDEVQRSEEQPAPSDIHHDSKPLCDSPSAEDLPEARVEMIKHQTEPEVNITRCAARCSSSSDLNPSNREEEGLLRFHFTSCYSEGDSAEAKPEHTSEVLLAADCEEASAEMPPVALSSPAIGFDGGNDDGYSNEYEAEVFDDIESTIRVEGLERDRNAAQSRAAVAEEETTDSISSGIGGTENTDLLLPALASTHISREDAARMIQRHARRFNRRTVEERFANSVESLEVAPGDGEDAARTPVLLDSVNRNIDSNQLNPTAFLGGVEQEELIQDEVTEEGADAALDAVLAKPAKFDEPAIASEHDLQCPEQRQEQISTQRSPEGLRSDCSDQIEADSADQVEKDGGHRRTTGWEDLAGPIEELIGVQPRADAVQKEHDSDAGIAVGEAAHVLSTEELSTARSSVERSDQCEIMEDEGRRLAVEQGSEPSTIAPSSLEATEVDLLVPQECYSQETVTKNEVVGCTAVRDHTTTRTVLLPEIAALRIQAWWRARWRTLPKPLAIDDQADSGVAAAQKSPVPANDGFESQLRVDQSASCFVVTDVEAPVSSHDERQCPADDDEIRVASRIQARWRARKDTRPTAVVARDDQADKALVSVEATDGSLLAMIAGPVKDEDLPEGGARLETLVPDVSLAAAEDYVECEGDSIVPTDAVCAYVSQLSTGDEIAATAESSHDSEENSHTVAPEALIVEQGPAASLQSRADPYLEGNESASIMASDGSEPTAMEVSEPEKSTQAEANAHILCNEAATRVQRQFLRFVYRRNLLEQLQFFNRQQRRETRKKTRRLSASALSEMAVPIATTTASDTTALESTQPLPLTIGCGTVLSELDGESSLPSAALADDTDDRAERTDAIDTSGTRAEDRAMELHAERPSPLQPVEDEKKEAEDEPRELPAPRASLWERYVDSSTSKSFYYSPSRGVTQWERPGDEAVVDLAVPEAANAVSQHSMEEQQRDQGEVAELSLRERWERYMDSSTNKSYYFNPSLGVTQWDRPTQVAVIDKAAEVTAVDDRSSSEHDPQSQPEHVQSDHAEQAEDWEEEKATATLLESHGGWDRYLKKGSGEVFFHHPERSEFMLASAYPGGAPDEFTAAKNRLIGTHTEDQSTRWSLRRNRSLRGDRRGEWQAFVDTETHQTFYYNTATNESTWEKPAAFQQQSSAEQSYQWVVYTDASTGQQYYVNLATNETTWEKPEDFDGAVSDADLSRMTSISEPASATVEAADDQDDYIITVDESATVFDWDGGMTL